MQQAMEQAQMVARINGMKFGENVPFDQLTVELPYPDWERLLDAAGFMPSVVGREVEDD